MTEPTTPPLNAVDPSKTAKVIDSKEIFSFLSYDDVEFKSTADFIDRFRKDYISRNAEFIRADDELAGQVLAGKQGAIKRGLMRVAKEIGLEVKEEDFRDPETGKDPKIEKLVEGWALKFANHNSEKAIESQNKIKELEAKIQAGVGDETKQLQSQLEAEKKRADELNGKLSEVETTWQGKLTEKENEIKTSNKKRETDKVWNGFKWANTVDDLKKEGFQARMEKNFIFDFDEKGDFVPYDSKKQRIKDPKKADSFITVDQLLTDEGIKAGVYSVAPTKQPTAPRTLNTPAPATPNGSAGIGLTVNPLRPTVRR